MTLTTSRLKLSSVPLTPVGIAAVVHWLNDPEVVRYSEQRHKKHTIESQQAYIESFRFSKSQIWTIHINDSGHPHLIGTMTAYIDEYNSVADVGILIGEKSCWGQGYGTEAWTAFCDHLLVHGVRKIEAGCMSGNHAMKKIAANYRMIFEGFRHKHFIHNGWPCDMLMWGKCR